MAWVFRTQLRGGLTWSRAMNVWRWIMAYKNLKVLDSDIHIIEPADLWPRYIDPEFRDRAPSGVT